MKYNLGPLKLKYKNLVHSDKELIGLTHGQIYIESEMHSFNIFIIVPFYIECRCLPLAIWNLPLAGGNASHVLRDGVWSICCIGTSDHLELFSNF